MELFENNSKFSLVKIVILFYITASSSSLFNLLSKQTKATLENSRIAQHILGFLTLMSLVIMISDGKFSSRRIFLYSVIGYLWFIISTKMDLHFNIIVYGTLMLSYLYFDNLDKEEKRILNDVYILNDGKLLEISKRRMKAYYCIAGIIFLTLIGTSLYSNKKQEQYGGGYSLVNFLLY